MKRMLRVLKNNLVDEEEMLQNPQQGINTVENNLKKIMTHNSHKNELKRPYYFKNTVPVVREISVIRECVITTRDFL